MIKDPTLDERKADIAWLQGQLQVFDHEADVFARRDVMDHNDRIVRIATALQAVTAPIPPPQGEGDREAVEGASSPAEAVGPASTFDPSPWTPESDPERLKVLGKLGEEAGELATACCRAIIQGLDECEPVTGKPNRLWIEDEIADVCALIHVTLARLDLRRAYIETRAIRKRDFAERWLDGLSREAPAGSDPR